jgi:solute:Na+ symporter, SSS family
MPAHHALFGTFPLAVFGPLDGSIVAAYFALVIVVGFLVARKDAGEKEFFLGGRSMPTWAVAISLVATMLSSATFVGVPDTAFGGDLSYLILNIGGILAVFIVAILFVPQLYRAGTVTIYGFLAQRFGESARLAVSCAFIFGRMLSSGARLFLASIPLCLLMFGKTHPQPWQLIVAISLIGVVGTIYATIGGVRAVVWVDTIQFAIVIGTAILTIGLLLHWIPRSLPQIVDALAHPPSAAPSKLAVVDAAWDFSKPYTLWAAIFASVFLNTAAYGVDQDLAQRFLISKSAFRGGLSVIASQFIGMAVVCLFLAIGLLLYIFYARPDIMGVTHAPTDDKTSIYPWFLLNELPTGLAGIAIAGFFAIAQGSLDSAMNALASSIVADVYQPLRSRLRGTPAAPEKSGASKLTVAAVGIALIGFAVLCALVYDPRTKTLLDFALGVMSFALAGMLGIFLAALLTRRGNSASVIAALIAGALAVALAQDAVMGRWMAGILGRFPNNSGVVWWAHKLFGKDYHLAWPWWMPIGTGIAFLVCISGKRADENKAG